MRFYSSGADFTISKALHRANREEGRIIGVRIRRRRRETLARRGPGKAPRGVQEPGLVLAPTWNRFSNREYATAVLPGSAREGAAGKGLRTDHDGPLQPRRKGTSRAW